MLEILSNPVNPQFVAGFVLFFVFVLLFNFALGFFIPESDRNVVIIASVYYDDCNSNCL